MKTLIIHPEDSSTSFLNIVYESIENKTVVTGGISKVDVMSLIREHDRVMMMGHGSPGGLFNVGKFKNCGAYIIDQGMVPLLKEKDNSVFIWCNADKFVNRHELKGFYSGMFISEVSEATFCDLPNTPQSIVDESNNQFATIVGKVIDKPLYEAYKSIRQQYKILAENNNVAQYNYERLYLN